MLTYIPTKTILHEINSNMCVLTKFKCVVHLLAIVTVLSSSSKDLSNWMPYSAETCASCSASSHLSCNRKRWIESFSMTFVTRADSRKVAVMVSRLCGWLWKGMALTYLKEKMWGQMFRESLRLKPFLRGVYCLNSSTGKSSFWHWTGNRVNCEKTTHIQVPRGSL